MAQYLELVKKQSSLSLKNSIRKFDCRQGLHSRNETQKNKEQTEEIIKVADIGSKMKDVKAFLQPYKKKQVHAYGLKLEHGTLDCIPTATFIYLGIIVKDGRQCINYTFITSNLDV